MAGKRKPAKKRDPNQVTAAGKPDEDQGVAIARTVLRPTVQAAITLKEYGKSYGDLDLAGLIDSLTELTRASTDGDRTRAEAMLTAQAHTLDAIFNNLARRAALNMGEYLGACETYLKLALRAQSQCRSTWEALATIKNPPVVGYVRQGEHRARSPAGEQHTRGRPQPQTTARGRKSESKKQTIGGDRCRTAGHRNDEHAMPS